MKDQSMEDLKRFNLAAKEKRLSMWYVACPYFHEDPEVMRQRISELAVCVKHILKNYEGVVVHAPVLSTLNIQAECGIETPLMGWYAFDLAYIERMFSDWDDRLVVLEMDGWQTSKGVALEIQAARDRSIPIFFMTVDELLSNEEIPF